MDKTAEVIINIIIDWAICAFVVAIVALFVGLPMWMIAMGKI